MARTAQVKIIPRIVCLCGSTRFKDAFLKAQAEFTLKGYIILSVGMFTHTDLGGHAEEVLGEGVKAKLDWLHKQKILLADDIYILNVDGYIGESTRSELEFARNLNKHIYFLEPEKVT